MAEKRPRVVEIGRNAKFMLTNSLRYNGVIEHSQRDDIYLGDIFYCVCGRNGKYTNNAESTLWMTKKAVIWINNTALSRSVSDRLN